MDFRDFESSDRVCFVSSAPFQYTDSLADVLRELVNEVLMPFAKRDHPIISRSFIPKDNAVTLETRAQ